MKLQMTETDLLSVQEQIQQDIISYASMIDDQVLDELCQIVVDNFTKLLNK